MKNKTYIILKIYLVGVNRKLGRTSLEFAQIVLFVYLAEPTLLPIPLIRATDQKGAFAKKHDSRD